MRLRSTFARLLLDNLVVMAITLVAVGLLTYRQLDANYQAESRRSQDRLLHWAAAHFQEAWPLEAPRIQETCRLWGDAATRLTVVAADGAVLGDTQADPAQMANHRTSDRPEIIAALAGKEGQSIRRSETVGVLYRYAALPLVHEGQVVAAVRLAVPVKTIAEGESTLKDAIIWSALAGTAAAALLGILTTWRWYAPLRRITRAARQIASGDLSSRWDVGRQSRLADLAAALAEMRDSLGKSLAQIASQHQDFQTVLANLREGVIATNAEGQIVLINEAASKLLLVDQPHLKGKPFGAVVRHPDLVDLHDRARASTTPIRRQFETSTDAGRRVVEAHGVKVPPGPSQISRLLVLRDVTDLAEMAAMKAQFVANASHELRTPLATIRAAVDSLSAVETDDAAGLAKLRVILDRHVRRLEEMTKDLLDLHMVESAKFPLRMQPMTLDDLAEWVGSQFCDRASEKGLTLIAKAEGPEHSFASDRKLVELILRNLVENAIKFTPAGGRIACGFETGEAGILMRISDTGCGIRREDQPRVFERFYQTDAARSGDAKLRGTGLGLAIVKHAAERLGAKVELQSDLGRGTTVTVLLPPMTNAAVKS